MSAPIKQKDETGSPKRMSALVLILLIIGGTLAYAAHLPAKNYPATQTSPQVQGAESDTANINGDYVPPDDVQSVTAPTADIPSTTYKIVRTVDGDTVKASIDGKTETIRLIGVDTPETVDPRKKVQCFGKAASDYTKAHLLNQSVRLAADPTQNNRDKYGRLLRYIFLSDGTNFNEQLVAEGYAYEYTYDVPYQYQKQFKVDQAAAEAASKGLWAASTCSGKR